MSDKERRRGRTDIRKRRRRIRLFRIVGRIISEKHIYLSLIPISTLLEMVDDGSFMTIAEKYADYGLLDSILSLIHI